MGVGLGVGVDVPVGEVVFFGSGVAACPGLAVTLGVIGWSVAATGPCEAVGFATTATVVAVGVMTLEGDAGAATVGVAVGLEPTGRPWRR